MFKKQLITIAPYTATTVNRPHPKDVKANATKAPSPVSRDHKTTPTTRATTASDNNVKH